jgi:iron complex outermembrane receptor protein
MGGVVNALTGHDHAHPGLRGSFTAVGAGANQHGAANANFEYGWNEWLVWGGGGGQRTGNYHTPLGRIFNSDSRVASATAGAGWFGPRGYLSLGYDLEDARYGIPIGTASPGDLPPDEEIVTLPMRRHNVPLRFGWTAPHASLDALRVALTYNQYHHQEVNRGAVGTTFDNSQFIYRTSFDQAQFENLTGTFGFEGWRRDYRTTGEEAIAPPTISNAFALFALEEVALGALRLQFGGRYENTRYNPDSANLENRSFHGLSASAGVQLPVWEGGSLLFNYTRSSRTPAQEELYNNGAHPGNLTFEIGNPNLGLERGNGVEFSLRQSSERIRGEANFYYYDLSNFVFLAPTGGVEDGLSVADYSQQDSRFTGGELGLDVALHPNLWINLGMDAVSAELKDSGTPLPRIPPLRGRIGFEAQIKGLRMNPELVLARAQQRLFPNETPTSGYAVWNLNASYTVPQQHFVHILSVNAFNLGDRLYRNHLSFIKEIAPEIGRGVRFSYTVRFF